MPGYRLPLFVPLVGIIVGALFVLTALARPDFLWNMGKVRMGREWLGDTGMSACFLVVGIALASAAAVLILRSRSRRRAGTTRG